ncbi:MAG: polyprenyl diphosphate synthase, partial [Allosphingosinicella sp.]
GARTELVRAVRSIAGQVRSEGLDPEQIDESRIEAALDTAGLPPLDLLIRTSGEHRLSNFLLWQAAYAELLFVDTMWPDFGGEAMHSALAEYARRERRYGGL